MAEHKKIEGITLTTNQTKVLDTLIEAKEIKEVIGQGSMGKYADVKEDTIFKALMDLKLKKIKQYS